MIDKKFVITFVCTGNTCRSPMAEGMFKAFLTEKNGEIVVRSRGIAANDGEPASTHAIAVMEERGIDIGNHKATNLTTNDVCDTDLFVCMTNGHADVLVRCGVDAEKIAVLNVSDPFGGTKQDYFNCAEQINSNFGRLYELIREKI